VGGCCGTTPEHIAEIARRVGATGRAHGTTRCSAACWRPDATEFIQRRNQALTRFQIERTRRVAGAPEPQSIPGYACYETVEETFAAGDAFIAAKPGLAAWASAGSSWLKTQGTGGYDMKVLQLTNRAITGDKPKLLINSAIHAREYTTAPLVLEFARWLVNGHGVNADATWILDHHEVHLMLHTNPDGRKRAEAGLSWRKNVNNNHCATATTAAWT
jgi:carboxypeptidase T